MFRRTVAAFTLALLLTASAFALGEGDPAPDWTLTDLEGVDHTLSEYQGKVVFLNIMGYS